MSVGGAEVACALLLGVNVSVFPANVTLCSSSVVDVGRSVSFPVSGRSSVASVELLESVAGLGMEEEPVGKVDGVGEGWGGVESLGPPVVAGGN